VRGVIETVRIDPCPKDLHSGKLEGWSNEKDGKRKIGKKNSQKRMVKKMDGKGW